MSITSFFYGCVSDWPVVDNLPSLFLSLVIARRILEILETLLPKSVELEKPLIFGELGDLFFIIQENFGHAAKTAGPWARSLGWTEEMFGIGGGGRIPYDPR